MPEVPQDVIDAIDKALTKAMTTGIAHADTKLYRGSSLSPWTRWQKPVVERCALARRALREAAEDS